MKFDDVKKFCGVRTIDAKFIKIGGRFLVSVPKNKSFELSQFLDANGVEHSPPCEILKDCHDIYLSLSG